MTEYIFLPRFRYVTDISNAQSAVVTCSEDHDFTVGQYVSFRVSKPYGMVEINEKRAKVLAITNDTIIIDLDTLNFNSFVYPVSGKTTPPVVIPAGSGVIPDYYPSTVTLFDVFDNRPI